MLKEKYLNEKFDRLKTLIFDDQIDKARECFKEILDLNDHIRWVKYHGSNIMIFNVHFEDLCKVVDVIDKWNYRPENILYLSERR